MEVSIFEGIQKIVQNVKKLKTKIVPLENAIGKISAKTLKATIALPRFNNSAMDGYGLKGEHQTYKIVGKILAGDDIDIELRDAECIKITTGARTPKSIDKVIPQEHTTSHDNTITIQKELKHFANIRKKGEDIQEEEIVINDGDKITSNYISLLASQGITHIEVYQTPRVAIFASGSELKMPYESLGNTQIYNSNTPYLHARSLELGCDVTFIGKSEDNLESLKSLIANSLEYDLIVTSGGVSVGEADFTKEAFKAFDMETAFDKVTIKPGKPTNFGMIGSTVVLNLPGNPLAASLNYEIFGKLIINCLSGKQNIYQNFLSTKMSKDFKKTRAVDTIIPGFFNGEKFTPAKQFGANMVNILNHCNGFLVIASETDEIKEGEVVKFLPIDWCFESSEVVDFLS